MRKKRILLSNETSLLNTGFSGYGFEFLSRLHDTGKYELAELATYGDPTDRRIASLPWKYYPVKPDDNDTEGMKIYNSKVTNQWGEWIFDDVCLEFKPDIVVDIRDPWMMEHEARSFSRPYFHLVWMPTVDSMPQQDEFIQNFINADGVFCYTDWALEELRKQSNGKINLLGSAPPGANLRHFQVGDKRKLRSQFGLSPDILLVGTVMRNQHRKLYPDLMDAFRKFLEVAPEAVANRTFLYIHAAHPDIGWSFSSLLKEHGIGAKTYFTYFCKECQKTFPSFFKEGLTHCKFCGEYKAVLPDTKIGVPPWVLSNLMGMFDAYVQYAICEGFGMPQVEAAASGTPVFAVDYSAMSDVVRKVNGFPIKVQRMFRELQTFAYRAYPDNDDLIAKLISFLKQPKEMRSRQGFLARKGVETHYTWEESIGKWEKYFDQVEIDLDRWAKPAKIHVPKREVPAGLTHTEFANWCLENVAGMPELCGSFIAIKVSKFLKDGYILEEIPELIKGSDNSGASYNRYNSFTKDTFHKICLNICAARNHYEQRRTQNEC